MPLSPGEQLGHYKIVSMIGKGGMGEVYLGTDTRLGRSVAIKVSSREFNDRFEREARAISTLNHPNICTLHDIGPNYLVMEYIEGETLSKIIERGPLPLDKALAYAVQIVDALAAAHAKGVIHRDLKPGNIIITKNGVKVLDFGLAKLSGAGLRGVSGSSDVATLTQPITSDGAIVGTLYYMSPEQVEAKETNERSDIFSFGAVLYEMITGQRPFTGDTQASVLAALLKDQPPPMSRWQPMVPRALERVVRKCLEKKPDDRWQSARDLKPTLELIDLDQPMSATSSSASPISASGITPASAQSARWLWPALSAAALLAAAGIAWFVLLKPQPATRVTRFEIALPEGVQVDPETFYVLVSPDGSKLAFATSGEKAGIWVRDLESVQARLLPGTANARAPFWSPDSRSLAFGRGNQLMRVDVSSGPPRALCTSSTPVATGFWTSDGEIVFGGYGAGPLQRVPEAGGIPNPVTALAPGEVAHAAPSPLPDGRRFLYRRRTAAGTTGMFVGSLDAKPDQQSRQQVAPIAPTEFFPTFVRSGNSAGGDLFFVRDGTLMAQPFDIKAMKLTGEPQPVVEQIGTARASAYFSVTPGGVMAYRTGPGNKTQLAWLNRKGEVVERIGDPGDLQGFSLSPDENRVALVRNNDVWLLDVKRNIQTPLTVDHGVVVANAWPVWSPDGKQVAYLSRTGLYERDSDGAGDPKRLREPGSLGAPTDWSHDGKFLLYSNGGPGGSELFALPLRGGGEPKSILTTPAGIARLSPDGRWIAYVSDKSGSVEVYVQPFDAPGSGAARPGGVTQISRDGGLFPRWSSDGKELFFRSYPGYAVMAVKMEFSGGTPQPTAPVQLFQNTTRAQSWDVSKDGQRFLMAEPLDRGAATPITVVMNWEASLKK